MFTTHLVVSNIASMPELSLTESESKEITRAVLHVSEVHGVGMFLDEKSEAWANLLLVAGGIYGPKIVGGFIRRKVPSKKPHIVAQSAKHSESIPDWMQAGKVQ